MARPLEFIPFSELLVIFFNLRLFFDTLLGRYLCSFLAAVATILGQVISSRSASRRLNGLNLCS